MESFDKLKENTSRIMNLWEKSYGVAPKSVSNKLAGVMLPLMNEVTNSLEYYIEKKELTTGELIIARTVLGSLVESWLKFFYCVFYEDYKNSPIQNKKGIIEPNEMSFEGLKQYSANILFTGTQDPGYLWIEKCQQMRNSIHFFNPREIGTREEFLEDVRKLNSFVEKIDTYLPPLEDYIEMNNDYYL